jgi:membrane protease YdiL (CAAX protease family)
MNLNPQDSNNNNSKGVSYFTGFFMLLGFALLGLVVVSSIILLAFPGVEGLEKELRNPDKAGLVRTIQVVSVVVSMFIPAVAVAFLLNRKPFQLLGYKKHVNASQVGITLAIILISIFVAASFGALNQDIADAMGWKAWSEKLEEDYNSQVAMMLDMNSTWGYLLSIIIMAFLPALCEETLFRGGLQNFLGRATKKPWLAIVVVSILFSLVHFSVYGFLVRVFLGVMLGAVFYYTRNLWLSITAHFFNNALAVSSIYFFVNQGKGMEEAMSKDVPGSYWGFLAIPVLIILFRALKKNSPQYQDGIEK